MRLHEMWRQSYRNYHYCRHLSEPELKQRFRDVFLNLLRLTPKAQIGLPAIDAEGAKWMELWTHVLEEMAQRYGPYPNGMTRDILHDEPIPDFVGELGRKCAHVLTSRGLSPNQAFIKFGKPAHMTALIEQGAIRVQSASYYGDAAHNGAVKDDELSLNLSLRMTREDILKVVSNPQDVPDSVADQRLDVSYRSERDYWLYCVTNSIEPRLFVDFEATACVIIKDRSAFSRRLKLASTGDLSGAKFDEGNALYIDPLLPSSGQVNIPFSKHFRYAYQREFRFVWWPGERVEKLSHVDLKIGPLGDIAELVLL